MQNFVFVAFIVELMHNYAAIYAAYAANSNCQNFLFYLSFPSSIKILSLRLKMLIAQFYISIWNTRFGAKF